MRGHYVEIWQPKPIFFYLPLPIKIKKWLGYVDQYIIFPVAVRRRLKKYSSDTLFVFADHALGAWVPLVANRPYIIHCHDFLAQHAAKNKFLENIVSWTGRQYQYYIHRGYSKGKYFLSVSNKTQKDLHTFLPTKPLYSEVIYNGLSPCFKSLEPCGARALFGTRVNLNLADGYLLHVGGNQWYKNRSGVIDIYNAWRSDSSSDLPLILIGESPDKNLLLKHAKSPFKNNIYFLPGMKDEVVNLAYAGASVFLFPSLAEGFGWPIVEAMASGCPVITTNEPPMTEVSGSAAFLIPRQPSEQSKIKEWTAIAVKVINELLQYSPQKRKAIIESGFCNANRFTSKIALDKTEAAYKHILQLAGKEKADNNLKPEVQNTVYC
jgi:glycosyltransferase involved in cell wall biosynthesis